jgi:hypothetical protein|tara:strand:+ start:143 stop:736 length:594 start_codon:yes stop_codon:yes gene_type:complete
MLGLTDSSQGSGELQYLKWINNIAKFAVDGNDNILMNLEGLIVDPASCKTGWGYITRGAAPEWHWDEQFGITGPEPDPKGPEYQDRFKRGFSIDCFVPDIGWRTWTTNAKGPGICLENIWPAIHEGLKANQGKCAALGFKGAKDVDPMKIPVFQLDGWIDRPGDGPEAAPQAAPAPAPTPEPQPATPQPATTETKWF